MFKLTRIFVLFTLVFAASSSLWSQSPAPNPSARSEKAEQVEQKDPVKAEVDSSKLDEPNAQRFQAEKYVAKNVFSSDRPVSETAKFLSIDPNGSVRSLPKPKSQQSDPDDWQVAFAPYLYMTGISGTFGARGRVVEIDMSFGDVLRNLSFGLMGTMQVKKGRFVSFTDMMWVKMGAERNTPGPLYNTARADVNMFIFDPEFGYRVYESDRGSFDILGGIRLWSVENALETTTGVAQGFTVSQRKTWVAFVGGFHGVVNVSPRVFLTTKFDIGAGSGTDITTQIYAGAGFKIRPKIALIGGYRFLKVNHDDDSGFIFNTHMNGFLAGARFTF